MLTIPPLASLTRVTISIASRLVFTSELLALSTAARHSSSLSSRLLRISSCKERRASQRLMPRSTIEVRLLVGLLVVWVAELSHGFVLKGSSGTNGSSGMSEIIENASMSDGVDGGLGTGDEEVGKDTNINAPGPGGAAAKFTSGV